MNFSSGNLSKCDKLENSPRTYYQLHNKSTQIRITNSSSAKLVGVWAAWHQRSSWAQSRARVQSSGCHAVFRFSPAKTMISADK